MEMDFRKPFAKIFTNSIIKIVTTANSKLCAVGFSLLFPILPIATGISVKPIVVITEPVTIGGKKLAILEKMPAIKRT